MYNKACLGTIYQWKERCIQVAKFFIDAGVDPTDTDNIGVYIIFCFNISTAKTKLIKGTNNK